MPLLSPLFEDWLSAKDWRLHPHQLRMLETRDLPAQLLIAPTGAGKTLAGFLPSLLAIKNLELTRFWFMEDLMILQETSQMIVESVLPRFKSLRIQQKLEQTLFMKIILLMV